tara:strand:+ start:1605 stop:2174 length:570 start_codon:yes stop_codon:yes gene_type:complete
MELRNETKFNINYDIAKKYLNNNKTIKQFDDRNIHSIYFDNSEFKFFRDSEEGTVPRKKVRYRWYNKSFKNGNFEIKKTLPTHREKSKESIILKNVKNKLLILGLKPVLKVSYNREYYIMDKLRFTLDRKIKFCKLNSFYNIISKIEVSDVIFEFKSSISTDYSIITQDVMRFRTRYSKYCEGIKKLYV